MAVYITALPVSLVLSTQKLRAVFNGLFVISSFCLLLNTFLFFLFACHFLFLVFFPSSNFCLNLFLFSVFCSFFISFFLFSTFSVLMFFVLLFSVLCKDKNKRTVCTIAFCLRSDLWVTNSVCVHFLNALRNSNIHILFFTSPPTQHHSRFSLFWLRASYFALIKLKQVIYTIW